MSDFSDVSDLGGDSDVGSTADVNETNNDVDFGDGDGVNDFDDSEAQTEQEDFEYKDNDEETDVSEEKEEMSSEETADQVENDFDNSTEIQQPSETNQLNESVSDELEQELSSDEYADSVCADFEEKADEKTSDVADSDENEIKTEESNDEVQIETEQNDSSVGVETKDGTGEKVSGEVEPTETDSISTETEDITESQADTGEGTHEKESEVVEPTEAELSEEIDGKGSEAVESTETASNETDSVDSSEVKTSDTTDSNVNDTEKTAYFENASYQQGQNEYGYLGTCGPTSISNSLNRVTGTNEYTENKVLGNAIDNNLCHKSDNLYSSGGTTTKDVVNIIENVKNPESNIHTEVYEYDKSLTVDELANRLDNPGTVAMVGVDSATLWDQRGDVSNSGLFNHTDAPSDHWITVDSPIRDDSGSVTGFNVIDSGGGVDYVDKDKFESMYVGDSEHTITDPTVIIISKEGNSVNTYSSSDEGEKTASYKGNDAGSGGGLPTLPLGNSDGIISENNELKTGLKNTERDVFGNELSSEAKEVNDNFRGDHYSADDTFEASIDRTEKEKLVDLNASTTCELNENLDGKLDGTKYALIDQSSLRDVRESVPEITADTVMQKVIPEEQVNNYLNGDWTEVRNCCSKASDTAPFVACGEEAYKELRLDYKGNSEEGCNVSNLENNSDMYIIRFTSDTNPSDIGIPNDEHPCTGTGFIGSDEHLIPEYKYPATKPTDGAIYKIDADGNETIVGMWDKDMNRFYPVP